MLCVHVTSDIDHRDEVASLMKTLRAKGYSVARDWTKSNAVETDNVRRRKLNMMDDCKAVKKADVVVVLLVDDTTRFDFGEEICMAIALDKKIVFVSPWNAEDPNTHRHRHTLSEVFLPVPMWFGTKYLNSTTELFEYLETLPR